MDMTTIQSEHFQFSYARAEIYLKHHQCSSNGIENKLLITRIPTIIAIVEMFDFMYFNGFI